MMKKLFISTGILLFVLTGCSSKPELLLSYDEVLNGNTTMLGKEESVPLFAEDLCVIQEEEYNFQEKEMASSGSLLVDRTTKETIYADHVYDKLYPASITKLATALMVYKYGNLNDVVTISNKAANITEAGAKLCGFKEGDQITLDTLLNSLLIYSGNDAGIAIAEHLAGSEEEFCNRMNEELHNIGATQTHFTNSHGLHDDNHYTSVYDIYLMFNELLKYESFPKIINQASYLANYKDKNGQEKQKSFDNTNQYLTGVSKSPEGVVVLGGKTGTTNKAGNCLILLSEDSIGNDYISIVLNAKTKNDLYKQMTYLLDKIEQ